MTEDYEPETQIINGEPVYIFRTIGELRRFYAGIDEELKVIKRNLDSLKKLRADIHSAVWSGIRRKGE